MNRISFSVCDDNGDLIIDFEIRTDRLNTALLTESFFNEVREFTQAATECEKDRMVTKAEQKGEIV